MARRKHTLIPDKEIIKLIDYTLPKLKYSVNFRKIIRWLENFEEKDVLQAIDFLFYLEYIDTAELTFRMDEQIKKALDGIPETFNIFIYPGVSTYPKSTELINYIIKETPTYKFRKRNFHCLITRNLEKDIIEDQDTAIIMVDDFIGSGNSFKKGYEDAKIFMKHINNTKPTEINLQTWLDDRPYIKKRFLVSAICMTDGQTYINQKYPEIELHSEFRNKVFSRTTSPFVISHGISRMKMLALKYGRTISTSGYPPYYSPLGYDASESLVAFSHTTPNNTLPIIWGSSNWFPIYPRIGSEKIKQAKELKKEVAYYIGIMNRLGIDLYNDETIFINRRRQIKYNTLKDHSLLCVLKLLYDGYELPSICQLLGITTTDYLAIINYGRMRKLFDSEGKISSHGFEYYLELMKKVRSKKFIKKEKELFELKYVNYVPKSFGNIV